GICDIDSLVILGVVDARRQLDEFPRYPAAAADTGDHSPRSSRPIVVLSRRLSTSSLVVSGRSLSAGISPSQTSGKSSLAIFLISASALARAFTVSSTSRWRLCMA